MLYFFATVMAGAMIVSMCVVGIHAASLEGGLLYPLRVWLTSDIREKLLVKEIDSIYQELNTLRYQRKDEAMQEVLEKQIHSRKMLLLKWQWWKKPLLLCPNCMASFWSVVYVTYFLLIDYDIGVSYAHLFCIIPIASTITSYITKVLDRG
jgi:hypothetical protein